MTEVIDGRDRPGFLVEPGDGAQLAVKTYPLLRDSHDPDEISAPRRGACVRPSTSAKSA